MSADPFEPIAAANLNALAVAHHHQVRGHSYQSVQRGAFCPGCGGRVDAMYIGERDGGRFNWEARCGACLYRICSGDR